MDIVSPGRTMLPRLFASLASQLICELPKVRVLICSVIAATPGCTAGRDAVGVIAPIYNRGEDDKAVLDTVNEALMLWRWGRGESEK